MVGQDSSNALVNRKNINKKSIDGSVLKKQLDPIAAKKEAARKKAMGIVGKAFENEQKIDADIETRRQKIQELRNDKGVANTAIREIEENRENLRKSFGVEADSKEEKDLKLLEKEIKSKIPGSDIHLTKDERESIAKIKAGGLTDYQQQSLAMLQDETPYAMTVYECDREIETENRIISATNLERLKSHAMVDAQKEADAVMDQAAKEIIGMVVDEAKDNIDKDMEEKREAAKEKAAKEEELEAKTEKAKNEKEIMSGNVKLAMSHVVPDIVQKIYKGQDPLHILGSGEQIRHYTYGGDLARGIRMCVENEKAINEDFNLSTPVSTTVKELATLIWKKLGKTNDISFISDPAFEYDVQKRVPSVQKAKDILGFSADTDLSTTLDEVIPWVCNQIDLGNI